MTMDVAGSIDRIFEMIVDGNFDGASKMIEDGMMFAKQINSYELKKSFLFLNGLCHWHQQEYGLAGRYFMASEKINAYNDPGAFILSAYLLSGKYETARSYLSRRTRRLKREYVESALQEIDVCLRHVDLTQFKRKIRLLEAVVPYSRNVRFFRALYKLLTERPIDNAAWKKRCEMNLEKFGFDVKSHLMLALIHESIGENRKALEYYRNVGELVGPRAAPEEKRFISDKISLLEGKCGEGGSS